MAKSSNDKGSGVETLPNQHTLSRLVNGDTWERSINNYAKVTPSGEAALTASDINELSRVKF